MYQLAQGGSIHVSSVLRGVERQFDVQ